MGRALLLSAVLLLLLSPARYCTLVTYGGKYCVVSKLVYLLSSAKRCLPNPHFQDSFAASIAKFRQKNQQEQLARAQASHRMQRRKELVEKGAELT